MNLLNGDPNCIIWVEDLYDGEAYMLTQVEDGEDTDCILMDRSAAKEVVRILQSMIGNDDE